MGSEVERSGASGAEESGEDSEVEVRAEEGALDGPEREAARRCQCTGKASTASSEMSPFCSERSSGSSSTGAGASAADGRTAGDECKLSVPERR
jgi:hypothetical protein